MSQIILVRHGQASFGADDYDVLSPLGERQASVTGAALAKLLDSPPDRVVHGSLKRQTRTAQLLVEGAGWQPLSGVDERWNEMDHLAVVAAQPAAEVPGHDTWVDGKPDKHQFHAWFEKATARWTSGDYDDEYAEPFPAFRARVASALTDLVDSQVGTTVVVTSGGPIAAVTTDLLQAGLATHTHLTVVVANASLTRIITGRRGASLVTFNEHQHLPGDLLTYR